MSQLVINPPGPRRALPVFQPSGTKTVGLRPLHLGERDCTDCGTRHLYEACPFCGSHIELGYGLAYGGFGSYATCGGETGCPWFFKEILPTEDAAPATPGGQQQ